MFHLHALLPLLALACDPYVDLGEGTPEDDTAAENLPDDQRDLDGDGYTADEDCDDDDPDAHPGGDEGDEADGVDNDCNGVADDRSVCTGDVADYDDLSEGIDDAPDGFVLLVCPGTYEENLVIDDRELTIRATDGADVTSIVAAGAGSVVDVLDGDVAIDGFTIEGGAATFGGGIHCDGADLMLSGNVVQGNTAETGGGFGSNNCDLDVVGNSFNANVVTGLGGGALLNQTDGTFQGNEVDGNEALEGGGLAVNNGQVEIIGNTVSGNLATTTDEDLRGAGSGGGGVWSAGSNDFTDNVVSGNTSAYNGGGMILFQTTGEYNGNTVSDNVSQEDGAGIYANQSRSRIIGNTISGNEAWDDAGGLRSYVGRLYIEGNTFEGNSAGDDGGGLKMSHSSNTVIDNTFLFNHAGDAGGGLELDNETAQVSGCYFEGNTATRGAGIHSWTNEGRFTISDSQFVENTASDCGGAIGMDNNPYLVTLTGLSLTDNFANDGAGLCIDFVMIDPGEETERYYVSNALLVNSFVSDNDAEDDGGIAYVKAGNLEMRNVTTHDNDSPNTGGVAVKEEGTLNAINTIFSGVDGDMLYLESDGAAEFSYCSFWNADGWVNASSPVGSNGNGSFDPDFDDPDGLDFHLGSNSECVDAGDPSIDDPDGSRSDMGAHGGPGAL